jgi:hypothetical protein
MRYLAVLLVLSTFLFSCKKKYHMVGRVINPITGEGIANAKVKFSRTTFDELPGGDEEVANTLTDLNGNYDLEFKGRAEVVKLEVDAGLHELGTLKEGGYQQALQLEAKKTMEVNWHAVPYGQLKTNVTYRVNPSDQIFQPGIHYGCYNYSGPPSSNIPMGYYDFTWTVTKTSTGTNTFTEEVFVPAGGIGEITINY